jgi:ribosomal protein S12 methylthiotransferase
MNYYLESLGCPKNLVDAQGIARLLKHLGYQPVADPSQAAILIVNTCGFIEDAREESIDELRLLARDKRQDQILIAAGCLSQYWDRALTDAVPGLDGLLGTRRWSEIGSLISALQSGGPERPRSYLSLPGEPIPDLAGDGPRSARQGASAYLKIADGCSAPCAFCAIPQIKGPAVSRPPEVVIQDAVELVGQGVKEIVLIAQDTTAYGRDRGQADALPGLIQGILDATPDLHWLRLMYAYPTHVSPRLIEVMTGDSRVCHYLDLPLQHAHLDVLRSMKRPASLERTRRLVSDLRAAMPDLALRSSFIVGYPGETEREFQALLDLVVEMRFDRVGVFLFSPEEGTAAAALPGRVPQETKAERYERLMALQQQISLQLNEAQVGRVLDVLVEGQGDGLSVGRSYRDAPEVDGLVVLPGDLPVGTMVRVRISGAMEYDLIGDLVSVP